MWIALDERRNYILRRMNAFCNRNSEEKLEQRGASCPRCLRKRTSAPLAFPQRASDFAIGVALFDGFTLVVKFLALGEPQLHLGKSVP